MATITGTQQSDRLVGTPDDDTITGLAGHDVLTGGDGGDRFVYQRLSDLSVWTGSVLPWHETITDFGEHGPVFDGVEHDLLDFASLADFRSSGGLFIGDDDFSATGRNEYRFERFGEFGMLLLFDKGGDGTADRYLVLDNFRSEGIIFDGPSEHPIFTNLIDPHDFDFHYEVGTAANETIVGTDGDGQGGFAGADRLYGMAGDDRMYGKGADDEMFGGAGNDRLDGGAGIDTLVGGPGDDVYFVETEQYEAVIEEAGEGIDLVIASAFYNSLPGNVENLTLTGDAYYGYGNALSNIITGTSANNFLGGDGGNDVISGHGGGDSIRTGTGDDWIRGGTGADYIIGQSGADKFVYYSVAEIGVASDGTGDFIGDFEAINLGAPERDRIDLHRIDANTATAADDSFRFIGNSEFTSTAGELRDVLGTVLVVDPDPFFPDEPFQSAARLIEGDVDGDGAADFQLAVIQQGSVGALGASDFLL
jgi:Ca2+-binding RTX toxin-like protein